MVSTNRKPLIRAYMRDHGVKYTEALRALGLSSPPSSGGRTQYRILSWEQYDYSTIPDGPSFLTLEEAKAAAGEDGDVIVGGFFAPDVPGVPMQWHSHPHGNGSQRHIDPVLGGLWGDPVHWNDAPRVPNAWSRSWFQRFPTPADAAAAPGLDRGDLTDGVNGDMFRFVRADGALVLRALPTISLEAAFSQLNGDRRAVYAEMASITRRLDPSLGIALRETTSPLGPVSFWEFVTPDLASFVSWSSVDRHEGSRLDALDAWTNDEYPHSSSINMLPFDAPETCGFCDNEPITRLHPLAPGHMIGSMCDSESVVEIGAPFGTGGPRTWDDLVLMHVYVGMQFVSHDGCAEYWSE